MVAFPDEVISPVRFALVVTVHAVRPDAVPVMLVPMSTDGVPRFGVTSVGEVSITNFDPVPVCEATEVAFPTDVIGPVKLAFVASFPLSFWIACNMESVADTVPAPDTYPVSTFAITGAFVSVVTFPTDVTSPVKLAFVATFPAVSPEAVPVRLVATPDDGVPSAPPCTTIVEEASGSVKVFSDVVGPENFVKPFPVPPYVEAITCVSDAVQSKLFP